MSGIDAGSSSVRKGAVEAILSYIGGGTAQTMASGNAVRAIQPARRHGGGSRTQAIADEIARQAARRSRSPRTAACSASST